MLNQAQFQNLQRLDIPLWLSRDNDSEQVVEPAQAPTAILAKTPELATGYKEIPWKMVQTGNDTPFVCWLVSSELLSLEQAPSEQSPSEPGASEVELPKSSFIEDVNRSLNVKEAGWCVFNGSGKFEPAQFDILDTVKIFIIFSQSSKTVELPPRFSQLYLSSKDLDTASAKKQFWSDLLAAINAGVYE